MEGRREKFGNIVWSILPRPWLGNRCMDVQALHYLQSKSFERPNQQPINITSVDCRVLPVLKKSLLPVLEIVFMQCHYLKLKWNIQLWTRQMGCQILLQRHSGFILVTFVQTSCRILLVSKFSGQKIWRGWVKCLLPNWLTIIPPRLQ